jgi:hypothetical protein
MKPTNKPQVKANIKVDNSIITINSTNPDAPTRYIQIRNPLIKNHETNK